MSDYIAPVRDMKFVLENVVDLAALSRLPGFEHAEPDVVYGAMEECARFMSDLVAPTNVTGDQEGSRFLDDGSVVTPTGFKEAYRRYVEAGWGAVSFSEEFGGHGFPWLVGIVIQEMLTTANMAFSLCPMLTQGAIDALEQHGSDEQKATFLPKLVSSEWSGTMVLTETEAGSDVGAVRAKAIQADDGTWRITGQKIFITYGEHDLSENIVHTVLARTPGAPPGTKGISLFIVPKFLPDAAGGVGERNDVTCVSLEHKLGIHASPTAVMSFGENGGAVGYLVGEENLGMRYMFTMMNTARLSVGLEGLGISERAYQKALAFSQERRQGRAIGAEPGESSPIIDHPDVRRMLMTMKAYIEAMRCLIYANAEAVDHSKHNPDEAARVAAQELTDLLTPLSKAWSTDRGVELTSIGIQIHGGMGYVEETGAAQYFRDARIAPIYEGTNGIQAIDLAMRKLPMRNGGVVADFLARIDALDADLAAAGDDLASIRSNLAAALRALRDTSDWLLAARAGDPNDVLAGAYPYLDMFGTVAGGYFMAKSALAAHRMATNGEPGFAAAKLATARFYCEQLLPRAAGLQGAVTAGAAPLFAVEPTMLGV